jgi:hypothetical protein
MVGRPRSLKVLAGLSVVVIVSMLGLAGRGVASPSVSITRVTTMGVGTNPNFAMVRTANNQLHLLYQTHPSDSASPNGLASRTITGSGALGSATTDLSGWGVGHAGLTVLPNGDLVSVFGAISPPPGNVSSLWAITSTDGGATWSAPVDVASGGTLEAQVYGANVTEQTVGGKPAMTLSVAGGIVVQQGLGPGTPAAEVTDSNDNFAVDVDSARDSGSGEMVATWQSLAGSGGDFLRGVAPSLQSPQKVPGEVRNQLVAAGRDSGPGVFAAYTTDGTHVRLLRYGGGTVAVGAVPGLQASVLGVATGVDGRIWVMWGQDGHPVAVTRSNKAVTKFEPIQHLSVNPFTLYRLSGDGRLGPLDLLIDEIPSGKTIPPAGTFYTRVLPELSAAVAVKKVKNNKGVVTAHKLTIIVDDAGDPVSGAKVAAHGKTATTNSKGKTTITLPASVKGHTKVKVTHSAYRTLTKRVKL